MSVAKTLLRARGFLNHVFPLDELRLTGLDCGLAIVQRKFKHTHIATAVFLERVASKCAHAQRLSSKTMDNRARGKG